MEWKEKKPLSYLPVHTELRSASMLWGLRWARGYLLSPRLVTWQKPKWGAVFHEGLLYKIMFLQVNWEGIAQHLILCQGHKEPVPHIRSVLLEDKGLHITLHLTVKRPEGRSVLSPAAHIKRGKVITSEACSFVSQWICPNVGPPM